MYKKYKYELGLILVAILWALGYIVTKIAFNEGTPPLELLVIRFIIASGVLTFFFYKELFKITKKELKIISLIGVMLAFGYVFQTIGAKYTTVNKTGFYTALNIIFVPYVAWLLHKKSPSFKSYIATIVAVLGIFCISYDPQNNLFQLNIGDILVILGAFFFGTHIALVGKYTKNISAKKLILVQMYVATLILFGLELVLVIFGLENVKMLNKVEISSILYLALISSAFCTFLQMYFQKFVSEVKASILLASESLFTPFFALAILGEVLTLNIAIGALLILTSLIILETNINIFRKDK